MTTAATTTTRTMSAVGVPPVPLPPPVAGEADGAAVGALDGPPEAAGVGLAAALASVSRV